MENTMLKKENGVITSTQINNEEKERIQNADVKHLCWEGCANAYVSKCQKIADIIKMELNKYEFITDGYEIINDKGQVETLIVTKCNNYVDEKEARKKLPAANKIKLRNALMMAYFGETSIDDAYALQQELIARGDLIIKENPEEEKTLTKKL